jgi:hypothetical protein
MEIKNNYYVYLHVRNSDGLPFYVGKGINNRYKSKISRSSWWNNIVNKHGYDIIFLETNLTESESLDREIYWINRIGRKDLGNGPLVNMTYGGDGGDTISNHPNKKEIIKKSASKKIGIKRPEHSDKMKGSNNPMYNKKFSEEHKNNISKSLTGFNKGVKRPEHSDKMKGGSNPRAIKILNKSNGIVYDTIKEASLELNVSYNYLIRMIKLNKIEKYNIEIWN